VSSDPAATSLRIASLLPSATEIVCSLGLEDALVAVSHSCDFAGRVASLPRVTRTRVPHGAPSREIDRVVHDYLHRGESLYQLDEGLLESLVVSEAVDRYGEAQLLVRDLRRRVDAVRTRSAALARRPRVAFLEWADPPICGGHWNPELVELAGGHDGLGRRGEPSRRVEWEELLAWQPEVMVLACCGVDGARGRRELDSLRRRPGVERLPCARGRTYVMDGVRLFSRPGPSLVESLERLAAILHD
jgi:iron complex transport system substrate-binding protein